jgi:hypothetical protein
LGDGHNTIAHLLLRKSRILHQLAQAATRQATAKKEEEMAKRIPLTAKMHALNYLEVGLTDICPWR